MEKVKPTPVTKALNVDYSEGDKIWLSEQKSLRKLVGILGMSLPVLLYLFLYFASGYLSPLESMSHYYMTRSGGIFVIVVSLMAIFLLLYKGKEPIDFYISSAAGIFALCLLLFPTSNLTETCCDPVKKFSITFIDGKSFRPSFHYISAGIFLLSLAYMSLFLFTKSDKAPSQRTVNKKIRNRIYRVCGVIMIAAVLVIILGFKDVIPADFYYKNNLTFWMETVAVESFGFSWLVKGEFILKD